MLILIAESKTMSQPVDTTHLRGTVPQYHSEADEIMLHLRTMSVSELSASLKLGPKNAQRLFDEAYDFPNSTTGQLAGEAYTGVVFKSLDVDTLPTDARQRYDSQVCIVSSLYGLLLPTDIIKPYRLDFGMKGAPDGSTFTSYWKPRLTLSLIDRLTTTGESEILNLLPQDAAKCFDWTAISKVAEVYTATFKQLDPEKLSSGNTQEIQSLLTTPNSDKLKRLRGSLLRHILIDNITTADQLRAAAQWPDLTHDPDIATPPNTLQFITD